MKTEVKEFIKKAVGAENTLAMRSSLAYAAWLLRGKPIPAHGFYKRKILRNCARKAGLGTLVETGTAGAVTTLALERYFKKIYTIELDPKLYEIGKAAVAARKNKTAEIICLKGDSGTLLAEVTAKLREPALFWLDAHYSGNGTARGPLDTPIAQELATIFSFSRKVPGSVIVIDDMREFNGTNDYPELDDLLAMISEKSPQSRTRRDNDLLIIE